MNNEYIILNKTLLADKILELKKEREEHEKVDIGMFDAIWAAKTTQAIDLLEEILSLSTPLIPEIENAFDAGKSGGGIGKRSGMSNLGIDTK